MANPAPQPLWVLQAKGMDKWLAIHGASEKTGQKWGEPEWRKKRLTYIAKWAAAGALPTAGPYTRVMIPALKLWIDNEHHQSQVCAGSKKGRVTSERAETTLCRSYYLIQAMETTFHPPPASTPAAPPPPAPAPPGSDKPAAREGDPEPNPQLGRECKPETPPPYAPAYPGSVPLYPAPDDGPSPNYYVLPCGDKRPAR